MATVTYSFTLDTERDKRLYRWLVGLDRGEKSRAIREALAAGRDVVVKVDVQGAATIRKLAPEALLIFLTPPHLDELAARLKLRHTETEVDLARRIRTAEAEMGQAENFDYVVSNPTGDIDHAVKRITEIMQEEKSRPEPRQVRL